MCLGNHHESLSCSLVIFLCFYCSTHLCEQLPQKLCFSCDFLKSYTISKLTKLQSPNCHAFLMLRKLTNVSIKNLFTIIEHLFYCFLLILVIFTNVQISHSESSLDFLLFHFEL